MTGYGYGPPRPGEGYNVASLVLGLVGVFIPLIGVITAPLAIIFYVAAERSRVSNGMGVTGLILGVLVILGYLAFGLLVLFTPFIASLDAV